MKLTSIKPLDDNPRHIDAPSFDRLKNKILEFPKFLEKRPIVYDSETGEILAGNQRYRALIDLGYKEVPDSWVRDASDWSKEEKRAFVIIDNVQDGDWDMEILANEWDDLPLQDWGVEIKGFDIEEPEEDESEVLDTPADPITSAGDVYELNNHRIQCGDSTDADVVSKTFDGANPALMVTDPPYGVEYDPKWRKDAGINKSKGKMGVVQNDDRFDWRDAWALFPGDVAYVWHAGKFTPQVAASLEAVDLEVAYQIIWNKDRFALSRGDYHYKHEPCWYAVRKGKGHCWAGARDQSTVWDIQRAEDGGHGHGTQKPTECMARPIRNHKGDVYDPFLGSGTTLIAAEKLGRTCYGQELSPQYMDIIVARWVKYMKDSGRPFEIKLNGEPFDPAVLTGE